MQTTTFIAQPFRRVLAMAFLFAAAGSVPALAQSQKDKKSMAEEGQTIDWSITAIIRAPEVGTVRLMGWASNGPWGIIPYGGKADLPENSELDIVVTVSGSTIKHTYQFRPGAVEQRGLAVLLWLTNGEAIFYPKNQDTGVNGIVPWIPPSPPRSKIALQKATAILESTNAKELVRALDGIAAGQYQEAARHVSALFSHQESAIRASAFRAAGIIGAPDLSQQQKSEVEAIVERLAEKSTEEEKSKTRRVVAQALATVGLADEIVKLLSKEPDESTQRTMLWAILKLATRPESLKLAEELATIEGVTTQLRKSPCDTAAEALLLVDHDRGTDALCALLKEGSPQVREAAVSALKNAEPSRARSALSDLLEREQDETVRKAAKLTMEKLRTPPGP